MDEWSKFEAPKLVKKLEDQIQQKMGEEVSIEILTVPWTPTQVMVGSVSAIACIIAFLCRSKL